MQEIRSLITPENSAVVLIDHQPQMAFGVQSIDRQTLINNVVGLAKAAKIFNVPTVLTTVAAKTFSGDLFPEIQELYPDQQPVDRTSMNSWDDEKFRAAIEKTGRKKIVMAALWTEVCLVMPAIDMLEAGYEVYIVTDASGGTSAEAHERSVQRLIQAGAVPMTWLQVLLEFQRDWARQDTYAPVLGVAMEHAGAYGIGIRYAKSVLGGHANEGGAVQEEVEKVLEAASTKTLGNQ
ncbi:MAG TPA: hydrolase [Pyrinomonadaceae bacterium]|jgi:nicotinamidase-related amidase